MDKTNAGWRQGLGLWYDPAGEGVSLGQAQQECSPGSQEGGRIFRTGALLGAAESGGC